jgi:pyridoxine 4-dehydrogenase
MEPATVNLAGTEVPRIGLGTNRLANTSRNVEFVREAVAAGLRHIDTAHLYTGGESEAAIGAALSPVPEGCVIGTKGGFRPGEGNPEVLRDQIEESLRRLRTESIQLFYLHRVDPETPLGQSIATIAEYVEAGKIQHVGISEAGIDDIELARAFVPIEVVQNHYNLAERGWDEVVDYCTAEDIVFVPFFPLRGATGLELDDLAERHEATSTQIALAWLLKRSPKMLPIPGTLSLEHLKENLDALDLELSDDEFTALG